MIIKTSELKAFFSNASGIPTNRLLPVCEFLKFNIGTLTKTSLNEFIVQEFASTEEFLISEKVLRNFVTHSAAPEFDIKISGTKITLDDGQTKVTSDAGRISDYPAIPKPTSSPYKLEDRSIADIGIAGRMVKDASDDNLVTTFVFAGPGSIAGSDGHVAYIAIAPSDMPIFILNKNNAAVVSRLKVGGVLFAQSDNYHFFKAGSVVYGFIKPHYRYMDLAKLMAMPEGLNSIGVEKCDLVAFNEMAVSASPADWVQCKAYGSLNVEMKDDDHNIFVERKIPASGKFDEVHYYNPEVFNKLLKALPSNEITISEQGEKFYVTDASRTFTSILMKLKI